MVTTAIRTDAGIGAAEGAASVAVAVTRSDPVPVPGAVSRPLSGVLSAGVGELNTAQAWQMSPGSSVGAARRASFPAMNRMPTAGELRV
jgi:hypothetical protein